MSGRGLPALAIGIGPSIWLGLLLRRATLILINRLSCEWRCHAGMMLDRLLFYASVAWFCVVFCALVVAISAL